MQTTNIHRTPQSPTTSTECSAPQVTQASALHQAIQTQLVPSETSVLQGMPTFFLPPSLSSLRQPGPWPSSDPSIPSRSPSFCSSPDSFSATSPNSVLPVVQSSEPIFNPPIQPQATQQQREPYIADGFHTPPIYRLNFVSEHLQHPAILNMPFSEYSAFSQQQLHPPQVASSSSPSISFNP